MGFQWSLEDRSIGDGFVRIAREQIDRAIAIAEDQGEAPARRVHEARRRGKRLRALLRLVRPDFSHFAEENAAIRDAARGMSAARDMKVAADTLAGLRQWAGQPPSPKPDLRAEPDEGRGLTEFADVMRQMLARTEGWKTGKIDLETLADGLTDSYRKGLEAMRLVAAHPSETGFHEWRKHTKYHWNQLGLLEACAEDVLPSAHKASGELADLLGLHHDLAMLREKLDADPALFGDIDVAWVLDAIPRRQHELEVQIGALGRQVYAERPKALHARFSSYLEGWAVLEAVG